jgi:orotate phosphoribosyltransferase
MPPPRRRSSRDSLRRMTDSGSRSGRDIARDLLDSGAVTLRPHEPFNWASGLRAPIYCDNRVTLSFPAVRRRISGALETLVRRTAADVDAVAGVATAGIPQAALLAERLDLPLIYVRGAAKGHGRQNRIEGRLEPGWKVVVVEDLISTGGSSLAAVGALRDSGAEVLFVAAVFSYGLEAAETAFRGAGVDLLALATLDDLLAEAGLAPDEEEMIRRWREAPREGP